MTRKLLALLFAVILGFLAQMAFDTVFGQLLQIAAELLPIPAGAVAVALLVLGLSSVLVKFFVTGFLFWAGSAETWRMAGLWALAGGTALDLLPSLSSNPLLLLLGVSTRAAGAFLGAWYGHHTEHDPKVEQLRELIFRMMPGRQG